MAPWYAGSIVIATPPVIPVYGAGPVGVAATNDKAFVYMRTSAYVGTGQLWAFDFSTYEWSPHVSAAVPFAEPYVQNVLAMDGDTVVLLGATELQTFNTSLGVTGAYSDLSNPPAAQGFFDWFISDGYAYFTTFNNALTEGWWNELRIIDGGMASFADGFPTRIAYSPSSTFYGNMESYSFYTWYETGLYSYSVLGGDPTAEGGDESGLEFAFGKGSMIVAATNVWMSSPTVITYIPYNFTTGQNNTAGIFAAGSYGSPSGVMVPSPDGTLVYWLSKWATSGSPTVQIVTVSSNTKTGTLPLPSGWTKPSCMAVTPDGSKLLVVGDTGVAVISTTGGGVLAVVGEP